MEPWAITTITVMILAIFAATAIATLLDVFGIRRLPEEYRKPLFGALILEVVGIVLWQVDFRPDDSSSNSDDETVVTTSASTGGAITPNGLTGEISNGSEQPGNEEPNDTAQDNNNASVGDNSDGSNDQNIGDNNGENSRNIDSRGTDIVAGNDIDVQDNTTIETDNVVQLWAHGADQKSGALGQKPPGAAALNADYPGCVKSVLDRDTPFPPYTTIKAYECAKNVEQFRALYIAPYYKRKKLYDEKLVKWDKQLVDALDDVSIKRRRYIKAEKDRLNNSAEGELSDFAEIDRRSLNDKDYCATNNCQKP